MTTDVKQTEETEKETESNLPTHIAKVRHGYGKQATFEQIGAGWLSDKGSLYVKFYGTQIVSECTLYEIKR